MRQISPPESGYVERGSGRVSTHFHQTKKSRPDGLGVMPVTGVAPPRSGGVPPDSLHTAEASEALQSQRTAGKRLESKRHGGSVPLP